MLVSGSISLKNILVLEDDSELVEITCPGTNIPAWMLIRTHFLRTIMSELLYDSPIGSVSASTKSRSQKLETLSRTLIHNLKFQNQWDSEICIMVTGWGSVQKNGKSFDRLGGPFAQVYPLKSILVDELANSKWPRARHFERTLFSYPFINIVSLMSRLKVRAVHHHVANKVLQRANERAQEVLSWAATPAQTESLNRILARIIAVLPFVIESYVKWFTANRVKLLLKEDGCFGHSAAIITAARMAGVVTAEFQHGAVSAGHDGYNVAESLATNSGYLDSVPSYFLSYGTWWNDQINIPIEKIAVGNPHRASVLSERVQSSSQTDLLILGDGIDTKKYLNFARDAVKISEKAALRTVFRPHPFERGRITKSDLPVGCVLDEKADIYDSFSTSHTVVSELSTGLFEAIGLAKCVLAWETDKARFAFPELPFPTFSSLEELELALLKKSAQEERIVSPKALWAENWETNYRRFVEQVQMAS